jgi:ATP-dependent Clp protease ATP-binding subunit ClpA
LPGFRRSTSPRRTKPNWKTSAVELRRVVFGQDDAIDALVTAIKRSGQAWASRKNPSALFCLPVPPVSARPKWPGRWPGILDVEFMRYDMSEYMEKHAVARLIGAPPGYIGFDQGGLLTDGVRKHPYCVLLLDEIEKAHEDLFNILLQVLDHATLTDNNGKKADFRNVIVMMTSNAGSREMSSATIGFGDPKSDSTGKGQKAIEKIFSPEFRNRLDGIITFNALDREIMLLIVDKFMKEFADQLAVKKVAMEYTENVRIYLARKGHDPQYGARPLARVIQTEIKDKLADEILFGKLDKGGRVELDMKGEDLVFAYSK